ncbi:MAG: ThiF family adenylyltransferase [Paludibacteraceae bacterium]|nr:ThiF family adenylyltransferase [Paludibacteraceae bacterium]
MSWFRSERVSQARVMVVGCGALGNEVLKNLVLFGVQHLVVVDFDRVESSNLSRSVLFTREDAQLHARKIDAVKASIERINPSAEVVTLFGDIAYEVGLGWFRGVDVVIGCVDNRWARYCINRLCMRAGKPWVDGGIDGLEGTVRVFIPGENCYACNLGPEGLKDLKRRMPCSGIIRRNEAAGRAATTPVIASVIGAVQVQEALKLIHREQLESGELTSLCGRMFCYEGQHLTTRTVDFKAYDDDCPVHERWEPVTDSDLTIKHTVRQCLDELRRLTGEAHPEVVLNDCFVDYVESRRTGEQVPVMCPGREVESRVEQDSPLRGSLLGELYQHEYRKLDDAFPYPEMSLEQVGVPARDVLWVHTSDKDHYIALNG